MKYLYLNSLTVLGRIYGDGTGDNKAGDNKAVEVTFTPEQQAKVDAILAADRRKHQTQITDLSTQLEQFKGTAAEKEQLAARVKELQNQYLSTEEKAKLDADKAKKAYELALSESKSEATQYKSLFESTLATQAIAEAAVTHKAYSVEQLRLLLGSQVKVAPVLNEEGKPTGQYNVLMPVTTKDGKVIEVPVKEGVGKLRENEQFSNLFLVDGVPGTGTTTINNGVPKTGSGNPTEAPSDPAAYREWRKKNVPAN